MKYILIAFVAWCFIVGPRWDDYKNEKIAAYQATHGGDVCEVKNILNGVECRMFTQEEIEANKQKELAEKWYEQVAIAESNKKMAEQRALVLMYGN